MNILLHARSTSVIEKNTARFKEIGVPLDVSDNLTDGMLRMQQERYDRIFIGYCVPAEERLSLMDLAGMLHLSLVEIQDRNTVYKELRIKSHSVDVRL